MEGIIEPAEKGLETFSFASQDIYCLQKVPFPPTEPTPPKPFPLKCVKHREGINRPAKLHPEIFKVIKGSKKPASHFSAA